MNHHPDKRGGLKIIMFLEVNLCGLLHAAPQFVERFLVAQRGAEREGKCTTTKSSLMGDVIVFHCNSKTEAANALSAHIEAEVPKGYLRVLSKAPTSCF